MEAKIIDRNQGGIEAFFNRNLKCTSHALHTFYKAKKVSADWVWNELFGTGGAKLIEEKENKKYRVHMSRSLWYTAEAI